MTQTRHSPTQTFALKQSLKVRHPGDFFTHVQANHTWQEDGLGGFVSPPAEGPARSWSRRAGSSGRGHWPGPSRLPFSVRVGVAPTPPGEEKPPDAMRGTGAWVANSPLHGRSQPARKDRTPAGRGTKLRRCADTKRASYFQGSYARLLTVHLISSSCWLLNTGHVPYGVN